MSRDNNGVRPKVTHNAGQGSINRGNGQVGSAGDEGGLKPVGGNSSPYPVMANMDSHHSPKGSSGTERDNGGVGNMFMGEGNMGPQYKN